ncbi:hypothetical protein F3K32_43180 [Streptomyces sp. LBUM 1483]|uniref:hypothetical protein n=1 Tax=Streptomyces scabiei TaxID=1930 RepID=UPI001B342517|nr:hypothetical protein [Streptomyces sp. LBUM 1483]MBP5926806.1 hypothetical protein [Streptomyces sp. LBUM 1483]
MSTTPVMPQARKRRRKTRTRNVNPCPPIIASDLAVNELDLTLGKEHLVCPECSTWVPITGMLGTPKLVPHHMGRAKTADPRRCTAGSNRRVVIDVDAALWADKVAEADATVVARRSGRVNRKPRAVVPTPVHRVALVPGPSARLLAAQTRARDAVNEHRTVCGVCKTGRARCPIGRELEIRMGHTDASVRLAHEQRESALRAAATPSVPRARQWRRVAGDVTRVDDARRALVPAGAAPAAGARGVPLEPQDVAAHERRQAELGKQYAARTH